MKNTLIAKEFEQIVKNKFNVYNSLFLHLPYPKVTNIGILIPILYQTCKGGLEAGGDPIQILDHFFNTHTSIVSEEEKIDFMFRVIQYVERQVVLYDSVEDAAFTNLIKLQNDLTLQDYINVADNENEGDKFLQKISSFSTRIVFTAHPTQFYTPTVLDIISKLRSLITKNDINQIDLTLQQLGLTSLINLKKPSPLDEAKNVIYFMKTVYYDSLGELYARIKKNIPDKNFDNPDLIQFGFWPGGDRDGNPFVTAEVTEKVAENLRMTLMSCYLTDVKSLQKKLTFRKVEEPLSSLASGLYESSFDGTKILNYEEIMEPLQSIKILLINNYNSLYLDELETLIDKVKIFRTHFAALDIRQHHNIHKKTVEEILRINGIIEKDISELNDEELKSILINEDLKINENELIDDLVKDTIRNISNLRSLQEKNGEKGCNRYIISNAEDIYSVLFVYALLRWCCWENSKIPFDIIPLFESIESMANSTEIMDQLFSLKQYREHLKDRNNTQTIMLGFSDGTKDGGYLQANWSIFKTKENLTDTCQKHDIKPIFFDGRGGPPARGGGKTHRFYASQSDKIANHALQITIQGQTITSKFGTNEHFIHNSEQLLTAGLSHSLFAKKNTISKESRSVIEKLAEISFEKYNSLKNHKMFIPYLENKSTLKYYGETKIGSRPTKRGDNKE
ncbi:MAG: phosphoenolpyruvate carboxylase, partial [Melioribacteraceae bacterium]|nr:phosphoenolpyruvate carboxylase [Melioribacteraceae bacterium]